MIGQGPVKQSWNICIRSILIEPRKHNKARKLCIILYTVNIRVLTCSVIVNTTAFGWGHRLSAPKDKNMHRSISVFIHISFFIYHKIYFFSYGNVFVVFRS